MCTENFWKPSVLSMPDILRALQTAGWVIGGPAGAAARLGLKRTTLIAKMKKLGISRPVHQTETTNLNENGEDEGVATGA